VTFDYDLEAFPDRNFPTKRQMGFIADQVLEVAPELVDVDSGGYKAVAYSRAVALVAAAVNELNVENTKKIESLTQEIEDLKEMVKILMQQHVVPH
jgi:hypothetical protein